MAQADKEPKKPARDARGRLLPGHTANPSGAPKGLAEVAQLAREHTIDAIKALAQNLNDESGAVRNAAAQTLLDRGWGRAKEIVEVTTEGEDNPLLLALVAIAKGAQKKDGP